MKNLVVKVGLLVMVGALGMAWASCGGDSDDDATPRTSPAAATAQATTAANATEAPTSAATSAAGAENYADFSAQQQVTVGNLCVWAAAAAAGTLDSEQPFAELFVPALGDPTLFAASMRAGQHGKTLEPSGKALADAAASRDPADLKAAGTDISGACESLGWTPSQKSVSTVSRFSTEPLNVERLSCCDGRTRRTVAWR